MTYRARAASSKTWNSPLSTIVSKASPSVPRRSASSTWKLASTPRSAALRAGDLDGARGDVDAEGAGAVARGEDRVLAGAAAGVEECAGERAGVGEADEGRLRAADVPGRRRAGVGVIPVVCGVGCGHVRILSQRGRAARAVPHRQSLALRDSAAGVQPSSLSSPRVHT